MVYSEANAFSQFAGAPGWPKGNLMFGNDETFEKLEKGSVKIIQTLRLREEPRETDEIPEFTM